MVSGSLRQVSLILDDQFCLSLANQNGVFFSRLRRTAILCMCFSLSTNQSHKFFSVINIVFTELAVKRLK